MSKAPLAPGEFNPPQYRKARDQWPQEKPPRDAQLVLDLRNFKKPMVQLLHDGNRPVPVPGVLFYATTAFPATIFPDVQAAVDAIAATMAYRGGKADDYQVVPLRAHQAAVEEQIARRKGVSEAMEKAKRPPDCPICRGSGAAGNVVCPDCGGTGEVNAKVNPKEASHG